MKRIDNTQGQIFYGMHFYPGVARYEAPDQEPLTVFINESTIRQMGPTFAGCPIFVEHVEEVDENLNELRNEADGWVIESFFNAADGKTWAKFIIVSDGGLKAIQRGFRLSNAYVPQLNNKSGVWNGVPYQKEVTGGIFDHLAIVDNPRYEESVIMTPEEFKAYNDEKTVELKKLANSKDKKGDTTMKLNIFKRTKVENSTDLDGMMVELPKSKKELTLTKVVEEYDKILNMNGYANGDHMVKVGENEMSVNDLVKKHVELSDELEGMKSKNADREDGGEPGPDDKDAEDPAIDNDDEEKRVAAGEKDVGDRGGDKHLDNEEDDGDGDEEDDKKKSKMKNHAMSVAEAKRVLAREKALRIKNAHLREQDEEVGTISLPQDQVARGKARYGSGH